MNTLAQYFTGDVFSNLLTNSIEFQNPKVVLDLGIGNGSLTAAAQLRWNNASFFGVDVDSEKVATLKERNNNIKLYHLNSLDINLSDKINIRVGSVDIAICNPPYLTLERKDEYANLLRGVNLLNSLNLRSYTTDLLFIAQNLLLLKDGGILGVILPAGLICGHNFSLFRKDLIENHSIQMVIELEPKIFNKTEAKTFILILKKGKELQDKTVVSIANKEGEITGSMLVNKQDLLYRMDFQYHSRKTVSNTIGGSQIKNLVIRIQRGNYSKLYLQSEKVTFFHTTDFNKHDLYLNTENNRYPTFKIKPYLAQKGDIIVGRVGKTCHKQVLLVKSGSIAVSDCVYIIKTTGRNRNKIFKFLKSNKGTEILKMLKHGVCAQVISKQDLENIFIE